MMKQRARELLEQLSDLGTRSLIWSMTPWTSSSRLRRFGVTASRLPWPPSSARRAPVSAHLGDRAIVFADGRMEGFVGGACSREIIRQQALEAIQARCGRLVSIRPDAGGIGRIERRARRRADDVRVGRRRGCLRRAVRAARRLVVVGATPVAEALARLARTIDYDVVRVVEGASCATSSQEAAALGVTVAALDALEAVLRRARGRSISRGRRRVAGTLRRAGARDDPEMRRGVRRTGGVAHARGHRARAARRARRARRRDDPESGRPRSRRADARPKSRCRSSRRSSRRVRAASAAVAAPAAAPSAAAPPTSTTAVDPVCEMSVTFVGSPHGGRGRHRRTTSAARSAARNSSNDPQDVPRPHP